MSGFENYPAQLAALDREIAHYAALCGVDPADHAAVEACVREVHASWPEDKARQSLHGLLVLRIKLETEMLGEGIVPPPLHGI
ncbi:MAG: hypothetical protein C0489_06935 [Candidatus Accumulibacter sp.]|nr:hypothetical protein [Accumulibacter sp.]MBA4093810.1 hypothetical protein [Accumulibacter sp.]